MRPHTMQPMCRSAVALVDEPPGGEAPAIPKYVRTRAEPPGIRNGSQLGRPWWLDPLLTSRWVLAEQAADLGPGEGHHLAQRPGCCTRHVPVPDAAPMDDGDGTRLF